MNESETNTDAENNLRMLIAKMEERERLLEARAEAAEAKLSQQAEALRAAREIIEFALKFLRYQKPGKERGIGKENAEGWLLRYKALGVEVAG
jgi:hypothetical protein